MLIHKLITLFLKKRGGSPEFFQLQARDAIHWIQDSGVTLDSRTTVLDLGCGFGDFGGELARLGCLVTLTDYQNYILPEYAHMPFRRFDIDRDDFKDLGQHDLVICSNVLEHLPQPKRFLDSMHVVLKPKGRFYLSWTNWLSPWGGHEFSPFHYLGPRLGYSFCTRTLRKPSQHVPYQNLFPTFIGSTLRTIRKNPHVRISRMVPRYYPEFSFLIHLPVLREFLAWNCALLIQRNSTR